MPIDRKGFRDRDNNRVISRALQRRPGGKPSRSPKKYVQRPTKVRPARAKQSPFATLVTKILKLKARVRLDQRARQIKQPKLIQQFVCRHSPDNNKRVNRASSLRRPPDDRLLLTPVCRM